VSAPICLAQIDPNVQRCVGLRPGILDASNGAYPSAIPGPNIDHSVESFVPGLPHSYANDNQLIEITY
jgi:hypothetical protein